MALDAFKNFAKVTLSTGYTSAATTVVLSAGGGALLPAVPFNAVWWDSTLATDPADDPLVEIVRVTNIATDTLTITRAQEGTAATNKNTAGHIYKMIAGLTNLTVAKFIDGTALTTNGLVPFTSGTVPTLNIDVGNFAWDSINHRLGIGTNAPSTALDLFTGGLTTRVNSVTLVNGANNNVAPGSAGFLRIMGPTGAFNITGFSGGVDGRKMTLFNGVAQQLTIRNQNAGSTGANQIYTNTGADIALTTTINGCCEFIYSATDSLWILVSHT